MAETGFPAISWAFFNQDGEVMCTCVYMTVLTFFNQDGQVMCTCVYMPVPSFTSMKRPGDKGSAAFHFISLTQSLLLNLKASHLARLAD